MMQELIEWIKENKPTKEKLVNYKIKLCKEKKITHTTKNINILLHAQ